MTSNTTKVAAFAPDAVSSPTKASYANSFKRDCHSKALSALVAEFAIASRTVHQAADGTFSVSKYGHSRFCEGIDELRTFAFRTGASCAP